MLYSKKVSREKKSQNCAVCAILFVQRALFFRQCDLFFSHCDLFPSAMLFLIDYYILYFGDHNHVDGTLGEAYGWWFAPRLFSRHAAGGRRRWPRASWSLAVKPDQQAEFEYSFHDSEEAADCALKGVRLTYAIGRIFALFTP